MPSRHFELTLAVETRWLVGSGPPLVEVTVAVEATSWGAIAVAAGAAVVVVVGSAAVAESLVVLAEAAVVVVAIVVDGELVGANVSDSVAGSLVASPAVVGTAAVG